MSSLLISVIVPVYNIESFIGRCIESILAQTYKNIEIIIVDDGSTDKSSAIIDLYQENNKNIKVIHKKNEGVSCARLTGIAVSNGQYIGFIDGDDWIEPDMYELLINNAIQYNADISHCGYQMDFPDGHTDYYHGTGKILYQNYNQGLKELLCGNIVEPGLWNKLFRRELMHSLAFSPIWDKTIKINEDLLMNYILFSKSQRLIFEDRCKYHYTLRENSAATSKSNIRKITDQIKVMEIIFNDVRLNDELALIAYEKYFRTLIMAVQQNNFKEISQKAIDEMKLLQRDILFEKLPIRLKCMFYGATYYTPLYIWVRKMYDIISGKNHKYDVD